MTFSAQTLSAQTSAAELLRVLGVVAESAAVSVDQAAELFAACIAADGVV